MPTKLTNDEATWLRTHKETIERRNRILKGIGVFIFSVALTATFAIIAFPYAVITCISIFIVVFPFSVVYERYRTAVNGGVAGFIVGLILAIIYLWPSFQIATYPMQLQVAYPHQTTIQNCTDFTTSESGYINGQPINPKNTTQCNLPQNMAPDDSNPFNCNIMNKSIVCTGTPPGQNVTWQGMILNVSKRN